MKNTEDILKELDEKYENIHRISPQARKVQEQLEMEIFVIERKIAELEHTVRTRRLKIQWLIDINL